jgi:hypothetical protein
MMKLWDVRAIRRQMSEDDKLIEPHHTFRGHTGPLFALTANNSQERDTSFLYSAGSEGIIRIGRVPPSKKSYKESDQRFGYGFNESDDFDLSDGKNFCVGVFSSHNDIVW